MWGDEWGVAYNGERVRTQCHMHLHIGKLLHGIENPGEVYRGRQAIADTGPRGRRNLGAPGLERSYMST